MMLKQSMTCILLLSNIFVSNFYSASAIAAWVNSKSLKAYQNIPNHNRLIVAEEKEQIIGFGLLNLDKKSIDSLYVWPNQAGRGYGKILLECIEKIAQEEGIDELTLSSTLNAVEFYQHMGYEKKMRSSYRLLSGVTLDCISMNKKIMGNYQ